MGLSRLIKEPYYTRIVSGGIADINILRKIEMEIYPEILFVIAGGFIDDNNFVKMTLDGLYFITPLKRDSKLSDFSMKRNNFF